MTPKLYSALKWGALLGGALALFETIGYLTSLRSQNLADYQISECLSLILEAGIPFIAGLLAARATGDRVSGLLAGITAGVIVALVNTVTEIVVPADALAKLADLPADAPQPGILDALFFRFTTLGLGAWFGWIGGRMGVVLARRDPDR